MVTYVLQLKNLSLSNSLALTVMEVGSMLLNSVLIFLLIVKTVSICFMCNISVASILDLFLL